MTEHKTTQEPEYLANGNRHSFEWEDGAALVYTNLHFDKFNRLHAEEVAAYEQGECLDRLGFDLRNALQQEKFLHVLDARNGSVADWHGHLVWAKDFLIKKIESGEIVAGASGKEANLSGDSGADEVSTLSPREREFAPQLDEAAYYGLAGEIVRLIDPHTEADPAALLIQLLASFGNAIGRTAYYTVEATRHFMNLFVCLVGVTSKARKGTAFARIRDLFNRTDKTWEEGCIISGLASGEGLVWEVHDAVYKTQPVKEKGRVVDYEEVMVDANVEDKRRLVIEEEFAGVLHVVEREGNKLSPILRDAWDGRTLRTLSKNQPGKATGAHISAVGHITADELRAYLTETQMANGLGNRFLWLHAKRSKSLPDGGNLNPDDLNGVVSKLHVATTEARKVGAMCRSDDAREVWHAVYPELSEGKPGLVGAMCARAEAQVLRLSCLYALLDGTDTITADHLRAALALWQYCEASVLHIFGDRTGFSVADAILIKLRETPDGMTRTELHGLFGRNQKAGTLDRALQLLATSGKAEGATQEPEGRGRPAETWYACSTKKTN
jgi:hypothetical protein